MSPDNPVEKKTHDVLVIDDDPETLDILKALLSRYEFNVTVEPDPRKAIGRVTQERFAVVLTDIIMPEMSGLEVLKEILDYHRATQVILMTGYGTVDKVLDAYGLGASDYIYKPFTDLDEVVDAVRRGATRFDRWYAAITRCLKQKKGTDES